MNIRWDYFALAIVVAFLTWSATRANAHGEYAWIEDFEAAGTIVAGEDGQDWFEPPGGGCCGKNDAVVIPQWVANGASVGKPITITIDGKTMTVTVTKIYETRDPRGRAWATRHGCVFRRSVT